MINILYNITVQNFYFAIKLHIKNNIFLIITLSIVYPEQILKCLRLTEDFMLTHPNLILIETVYIRQLNSSTRDK